MKRRGLATTIGFCLLSMILLVRSFTVRMTDQGMAPTLIKDDILFVNPFISNFKHGDIVYFRLESGQAEIARVLGLAGEQAEVSGDQIKINQSELVQERKASNSVAAQRLTENDWKLIHYSQFPTLFAIEKTEDRCYGILLDKWLLRLQKQASLTVATDSIFVMPDNRRNNPDFNRWKMIKKNQVIGKVEYILWSMPSKTNVINELHPKSSVHFESAFRSDRFGTIDYTCEFLNRPTEPEFFNPNQKFKDSCNQGNLEACAELGILFEDEGNLVLARQLESKACDGDNAIACNNLAVLERSAGEMEFARVHFQKACDWGNGEGCISIGNFIETAGSLDQAKTFYKKACELGDPKGCNDQGKIESLQGNKTAAAVLFKKACEDGDMTGCFNFIDVDPTSKSPAEQDSILMRACNRNVFMACSRQGERESSLGRKKEAKPFLRKACDGGAKYACYNLGVIEKEEGNTAEAKTLYSKACDANLMPGCYNLGALEIAAHNTGAGLSLIKRACKGGDQISCDYLSNLKH